MNYPQYVIPGFAAAALHAVLLFGFKPTPRSLLIEVPLPPVLPPIPQEKFVPLPPEEKSQSAVEQRPLRGEPAPPDLPAPPPPDAKVDFPMPPIERPPGSHYGNRIPAVIGDPNGDPNGNPCWNVSHIKLLRDTDLDSPPQARVRVAPDYPFALRKAGIEGTVLVEFHVDSTGRVEQARVLRSSHREFEEPTLRAVRKWQFAPGRYQGRAVAFRVSIPVDFRIGED